MIRTGAFRLGSYHLSLSEIGYIASMNLLTVGDLHGDVDALFRLLDTEGVPDVLLCVGDWGDPGEIPAAEWHRILNTVPTVLTVFGNHDDLPFLHTLRNHDGSAVLLAQGQCRTIGNISVAGVSGIWAKSNRLPHYVTDEQVQGWADALAAGAPVDILLTHGCPIGIADRTLSGRPGGQKCFRDLLYTVRPQVYLCGHLHVAQRRNLLDPPCTVINTGSLRTGAFLRLSTQLTEGGVRVVAEAR